MSTLRRTGTTNTSAESGDSKWGSFLSYWSNPKSSSSVATSEPDELQVASPSTSPQEVDVSNLCLEDEHSSLPHGVPFSPVNQDIHCSVDEIDGTIDVDIPLGPTLFSPLSSPPQHQSWLNPLPSITNSVPITSLRQPPTILPEPDDAASNVAGWIDDERFHPDFVLQAIPSYPTAEADIKHAMHMEPTPDPAPVHFINTPGSDPMQSQSPGDWITVSETIVADAVKLQIKRIRLLRRRRNTEGASAVTSATTVTPGAKMFGAAEEDQDEESWEEEVLLDVDDVLATAIEKVVGLVPRSPGSPVPSEDEHEGAGAGCRAAVLGALAKVVKQVVKGESAAAADNVLTDGVKRWMWGAQEAF